MQLHIRRNQASGMLGGVKFELSCKAVLTKDESALVERYKAHSQVLLKKEIKIPFTGKSITVDLTIGSLASGQTFKCDSIADVLEYELSVKEGCENFKRYLETMRGFGGEEVLEF